MRSDAGSPCSPPEAVSATDLRVVAGPVEATAAGNILVQMLADGEIASLEEGREIVRRSFEPEIFEPEPGTSWDSRVERAERFL